LTIYENQNCSLAYGRLETSSVGGGALHPIICSFKSPINMTSNPNNPISHSAGKI
jgi:hypothetical protein